MSSWDETTVRIVWKNGVPFHDVIPQIVKFLTESGHPLRDMFPPKKCFFLTTFFDSSGWRGGYVPSVSQKPEDFADPTLQTVSWMHLENPDSGAEESNGPQIWGSFTILRSSNPGKSVTQIGLRFDGILDAPHMENEEFELLKRKYFLLKEMYHHFDCDEMKGAGVNWADELDSPTLDPDHRYKTFRFAKTGTQVLVRHFEEGRPSKPYPPDLQRIRVDR